MACHIGIKTDSPLIQELARFDKAGGEVPWEPVYVIADYVFFNHRNGLKCAECHPTPDPGDFAEIVGTEKCMACHIGIKTDSPLIQELARFDKAGGEVPWEPVYVIADYVFFNHRVHTDKAGAQCQDCHGPVQQRDALGKERDTSMAACMDCHRAKGGSIECNYCHDPR